ncbi:MAG: hypothetical protein ACRD4M_07780 [Candidatus Acidiferrales bacterium]
MNKAIASYARFIIRSFLLYLIAAGVVAIPVWWIVERRWFGSASLAYTMPGVGYWPAIAWASKVRVILQRAIEPELLRGVVVALLLTMVRTVLLKMRWWGGLAVAAALAILANMNGSGEFLRRWATASLHPAPRFVDFLMVQALVQYLIFAYALIYFEGRAERHERGEARPGAAKNGGG